MKESVDKSLCEQAAEDYAKTGWTYLYDSEPVIDEVKYNAFIAGANWSPVKGDDADQFIEMNRAIKCLALELPREVYDDVNDKWIAYVKYANQFKSASGVLNVIETNLKQKKDQWDKAVPYDEKAKLRAVIDEYEELKQKIAQYFGYKSFSEMDTSDQRTAEKVMELLNKE